MSPKPRMCKVAGDELRQLSSVHEKAQASCMLFSLEKEDKAQHRCELPPPEAHQGLLKYA